MANGTANPDQADPLGQNTWTDIAQILGRYAQNSAQGRNTETNTLTNRDRAATDLYRTQVETALRAPSIYASQAARGNVLSNIQPASISGLPSYIHMGQLSGGLNPSVLGPEARSAGQSLSRNALLQLGQNRFNLPTAPQLSPIPTPSTLDRLAQGGSLASGLLGALTGGKPSGGNLANLVNMFRHPNLATDFNTPGAVTGDYNPGDYTGINPETGLWDPNVAYPGAFNPEQNNPNPGLAVNPWDLPGYDEQGY